MQCDRRTWWHQAGSADVDSWDKPLIDCLLHSVSFHYPLWSQQFLYSSLVVLSIRSNSESGQPRWQATCGLWRTVTKAWIEQLATCQMLITPSPHTSLSQPYVVFSAIKSCPWRFWFASAFKQLKMVLLASPFSFTGTTHTQSVEIHIPNHTDKYI